jgi:decaprenylphospho-beta-D-erythro-pentofuranosid-2-ulose 2-reductase
MRDGLGGVQTALVLGASSDIAACTLHRLADRHLQTAILAARDPDGLDPLVDDLHARSVKTVHRVAFDATDVASHESFVDDVWSRIADIDLVVVAFGVLGDQREAERDASAAVETVRVNYVGAVSVLVAVAARLENQGHGIIVGLSSVAGERARRSNFIYGSSKAGLDAFLQGLGDRLVGTGVHVMVVRPGFVHTKMTAGLEPSPLSVTPEDVADAIMEGIAAGREIVWVPAAFVPFFDESRSELGSTRRGPARRAEHGRRPGK